MAEITQAELKWLIRLQKVIDACPSKRLGFYTIGDSEVVLYDKTRDDEINAISDSSNKDFCVIVDELDAGFGVQLVFPSNVHSTAG